MASLWPRIDWSALISPPWRSAPRCERVAKAVGNVHQLVVGAHEAVGLRERLERPADIACRREGRARLRQDVAVPISTAPGRASAAFRSRLRLLQEEGVATGSMGIPLASWVLVSLMNEPIPFAYATECLIEIRPVSKSTSHHRRPRTSPIPASPCAGRVRPPSTRRTKSSPNSFRASSSP